MDHDAKICVYFAPKNAPPSSWSETPLLEINLPKIGGKRVNPTAIHWTSLNEDLLVAFDNGQIRLYDPESGDIKEEFTAHEKKINRLRFNRQKTLFITSSADFTSKLYDAVNFKHLKTYRTDRPVNDAVISETKDHILLGGGQEAMSVTTTSGKVGKFETRFFHLVYEEEFGCVKGHFGPINARTCTISLFLGFRLSFPFLTFFSMWSPTVDINPNGRNYASGAEDGYVRLHQFDQDYLDMKDPVPEEGEDEEDDEDEDVDEDDKVKDENQPSAPTTSQ